MADAIKAKEVFKGLCKALDNMDWNYRTDEAELEIRCGARGEDLSMDLIISVDEDRDIITVISPLPFEVEDDKMVDMAIAINAANSNFVNGCFDYGLTKGHVFFRISASFRDSVLSEEVYRYLILCTCSTVDEYNDKLMLLASGSIGIEKFIELIG